jgi:predicted  nucleic acid-binding Zn-ribbon protein
MKTLAALVLVVGLGVGTAFGQSDESQVLQSILVELRGMHNDMRLSQTMQILLAEMQLQQSVVNKAQEKRDGVKNSLEQVQNQMKSIPQQIAQFEERAEASIDPAQKKQMLQVEEQIKGQLPMLKSQEQERSNDLVDAESRLRKEQDALSGIQDQLNAVVKKLQPAGQ